MSSAAASGVDSRVHGAFDRASKETFVESMLQQVADGLASDAPYGYNSANRIRRRVEDISEDVNESAGRAVLDARFALGHDDGQYLAQAVSMLWAGDGGERLRVVPAPMMPEIMRHASAEGIVLAMQSVMKTKRTDSQNRVQRGLALVGWLMQVQEIRTAVLDVLREPGHSTVVRERADKIEAEYAASDENGMRYVAALLTDGSADNVQGATDSAKDASNRRLVAETLLIALYMLTDEHSPPMRLVQRQEQAVTQMVRDGALDTAIVASVADELLGAPDKMALLHSNDELITNPPNALGAGSEQFCVTYDFNGNRQSRRMPAKPTQLAFQTAVSAAYRRMASRQYTVPNGDPKTSVASKQELPQNNTTAVPSSKKWKLDRVVSPFWNQGKILPSGGSSNSVWTAREDALLRDEKRNELTLTDLDNTMYASLQRTLRTHRLSNGMRGSGLREDRLAPDATFAAYCMVRGLCGYCGPHQESTLQQSDLGELSYNYPVYPMHGYRQGEILRLHDAEISEEASAKIARVQSALYSSVSSITDKLHSDFFGDVCYRTHNTAVEKARPVLWAPVPAAADASVELIQQDELATETCKAATYEFMARAFQINADEWPQVGDGRSAQMKLLNAAAGSAKIMQLSALTAVHHPVPVGSGRFLRWPQSAKDTGVSYITRPVLRCSQDDAARGLPDEGLLLPVDAGLARFVLIDGRDYAPLTITDDNSASSGRSNVRIYDVNTNVVKREQLSNATLTNWLRGGVQAGWTTERPASFLQAVAPLWSSPRNFGLYVGDAPECTVVDALKSSVVKERSSYSGVASQMAAADLDQDQLKNALAHALGAVRELEHVEHEEAYIERLKTRGSAEQQGVFGLKASAGNIEDASRDRRQAVWSDALREVAVSGDRLYRFVTQLTGAIGEAADSAISWEDEDLKQMAKDSATRQKGLAERVARFQTRLVESVVSSTLKASNLQLEVRGGHGDGAEGELVVLSGDVKDNLRQVMAGEGGHGLFEANVELNELLGNAARPMQIRDIVNKLQAVSQEFHNQVARELAPATAASYNRVVEPRNSYMLHMKPDTSNAIQRAFDYITAEMRHCDGYHRHIHLWEFVEGKDWTLCTRFAELVGLMLQNTRMRSGSFAAYVGQAQLIANTQNIRTQLQRLRSQVCHYLSTQLNGPMFLHKGGRTIYFGGSLRATPADDKHTNKRKARDEVSTPFDADDDHPDVFGVVPLNRTSRRTIRRRVLDRLAQMAREKREAAAATAVAPTVAAMVANWDTPDAPSPAGFTSRLIALHLDARSHLTKLLSDATLPTTRATSDALAIRMQVLVQLQLSLPFVVDGNSSSQMRAPNAWSNALAETLFQQLKTTGIPSADGRLLSASSHIELVPDLPGLAAESPVECNFVDRVDLSAVLPNMEHEQNGWTRAVVSLALNSIFGMPNTLTTGPSIYDDPFQWQPHPTIPKRWVRPVSDKHTAFQEETVEWLKHAEDLSNKHNVPVSAVLLAWSVLILLSCQKNLGELQQVYKAAEQLCNVMAPFTDNRIDWPYVDGVRERALTAASTAYDVTTAVAIKEPHMLLRRILEILTDNGFNSQRTRTHIGNSLQSYAAPDDRSDQVAQYLDTYKQNLQDAIKAMQRPDPPPTPSFGDWLQERMAAERDPFTALLLVSVESSSEAMLGEGTPEYPNVQQRVIDHQKLVEKENAQSIAFLKANPDLLQRVEAAGFKPSGSTLMDTVNLAASNLDTLPRLAFALSGVRVKAYRSAYKALKAEGKVPCIEAWR